MRRVVITGMGAVSAAGLGADALWRAARDQISGVRAIDIPRSERLRVRISAPVPDFDVLAALGAEAPRTSERFTHFALVAAKEAVAQSGLQQTELAGARSAAIVGTGVGGVGSIDDNCFVYYSPQDARPRYEPMLVPRIMPSSAVSHVSIAHGITGPSFGITSACASGAQSIGTAAQMISAGLVDRALAGGAEACITPVSLRSWELLRVLTPSACRPFSADRSGMVIGEGAAIFVLEAEESALARGAKPLAYLSGYGTTSDALDMVQPNPVTAAQAVQSALDDAGITPAQIGYVNAHGTATVLNDINEATALRTVFGAALDDIPVSSSKPILGHTLGAAGALELVISVQALRHQTIPPQMNFTKPDPKCPLNLPLDGAVSAPLEYVLSNSFAFGGINASLVVCRAS
jgi:nodulation protein E